MTIREYVHRKILFCVAFGIVAWLFFAAALVLSDYLKKPELQVLCFPGFLGFAGTILYCLFAIKCPRCGANLGGFASSNSFRKRTGKQQVKFCPFCGVNIDEEV